MKSRGNCMIDKAAVTMNGLKVALPAKSINGLEDALSGRRIVTNTAIIQKWDHQNKGNLNNNSYRKRHCSSTPFEIIMSMK